jgi:hypothetical protein
MTGSCCVPHNGFEITLSSFSLSISRDVYLMFLHYTMLFRKAYIFKNYLYNQNKHRKLIWEVACKKTAKNETEDFA